MASNIKHIEAMVARLIDLRTRAGLTQAQLHEICDVPFRRIIQIESGDDAPSTIEAIKLARACGSAITTRYHQEYEQSSPDAQHEQECPPCAEVIRDCMSYAVGLMDSVRSLEPSPC